MWALMSKTVNTSAKYDSCFDLRSKQPSLPSRAGAIAFQANLGHSDKERRGGRAAEGSGLLNRHTVKRIEGSNPSLSASLQRSNFLGVNSQITKLPYEPQYS